MDSFNFWSIQENLAKTSYPCDFPSWLVNRHYPTLTWNQKNHFWGTLVQNMSKSSFNRWCTPTSIMTKISLPETTKMWLKPHTTTIQHKYFNYVPVDNWIMVDFQQAGKYKLLNLSYILCYYSPELKIPHYIFNIFILIHINSYFSLI